ncbi:hypothetical protein Tco_1213144 [Tanacetum coccineum]
MKLTKTSLKHTEILSRLKDVKMMRIKMKNPSLDQTSAPKEKTSKSKEGSKSHHTSTRKSAQEETIHADKDLEEPAHQEFDTGFTEDQSVDETTQHPDWFLKPSKTPTLDHDWNKTLPTRHGPLYTFKEGDYNRLHLQDIEDMLLLLVQGKLTNLNVEECLALGISPSDLKRKTPYTAYSNPKGFIYQNKDKKNRLMCIDELHKFSDGTLNDVRSALDDILKRIWIEYLP